MVDYNSLQCVDNYIYDSGWIYDSVSFIKGGLSYGSDWYWQDVLIAQTNSTQVIIGSKTYYQGAKYSGASWAFYYIKYTQPSISYKSFSSF